MKKKAREFGTQLIIKRFDFFRESYSEQGTNDQDLVARIYRSCQVAHIWRCHNVSHGYFYRCPQSIFIPEVVGESHKSDFDGDRLRIHNGDSFGEELLDFLERSTPLSACSYCLGSVGRSFPHAQVVRSSWRKFQKYRTEDLVDWAFLKTLEDKADTKNGCFLEIN